MKVDIAKLSMLVKGKYLTCKKHPTADLLIWNYSHLCQFERYWTEETMMCRGLITDLEGNIVARPFKKFFNLGEGYKPGEPAPPLPDEPFEIYEKYDGSLGILYWDGESHRIATRGSFESEQAIKATEMLQSRIEECEFRPGWTYLFEIIYPENRIVVDYGGIETLILLDVLDNETGNSVLDLVEGGIPFQCARRHEVKSIDDLLKVERENAEGFVVRFRSGLRVKIKHDEYCRLHKLLTGINDKRIWEMLSNGDSIEQMIDSVPDEFYQYVKGVSDHLHQRYADIEADTEKYVNRARKKDDRAKQAKIIKKCEYPGVGFAMLDGKDYQKVIWSAIKPKVEEDI